MLNRSVSSVSAGGTRLILVALVGFLLGLLGVFVGRSVESSLAYAEAHRTGERRPGDGEMGRWGDGETGREGTEVRAETLDVRGQEVVAKDEEMRTADERLIIGKEKSTGHIILTGGNVGIGTTTPAQKLDVAGKIRIGDDVIAGTPGTIRWTGTYFEGYTGTAWVRLDFQTTSDGGWTDDETVVRFTTSSDSVGIGTTTPAAKLHVTTTDTITVPFQVEAGVPLQETVFYIQNRTGNIGIGTTNPGYKLEVIGTGRFSGLLTKSGGGFLIDHPNPDLRDDYYLSHGFIEGEEHGVIYRGEAVLVNGAATVSLPDYFEYLVDEASTTIQLIPKNGWSPLYVDSEVKGNQFIVKTTEDGNQEQGFYWQVQGTRKDTFVLTDKHAQLMGTVPKSNWDESENK